MNNLLKLLVNTNIYQKNPTMLKGQIVLGQDTVPLKSFLLFLRLISLTWLSQSAQAAMKKKKKKKQNKTKKKHHRLHDLNNRILFSYSSGAREF